jgi:hypothetical protein
MGNSAGLSITSGGHHVAIGHEALATENVRSGNVAIGFQALKTQDADANTYSVAVGYQALTAATIGLRNVAVGGFAGVAITEGDDNIAIGHGALNAEDGGNRSVAIGSYSLYVQDSTDTNNNVGVGYNTGKAVTSGIQNTFIGAEAGNVFTTGENVTALGYGAQPSTIIIDDEITLGNGNIAVLRCQVTSITALSDKSDKTNIEPLHKGLDFVDTLKPVKFDWDTRDGSKKGIKDIGFIAQDLQEVDDEYTNLVYNSNPEKLEASYGRLVPVLVKAVQELSAEVKQLKQQLNN